MENLLVKLRQDYPEFKFEEASIASWSPQLKQVSYSRSVDQEGIWSLLHELGHAIHNHQNYTSDINLVRMESDAWEKALEISNAYDIAIDNEHLQECMDTYRDWLYKRSTCPYCKAHGLQRSKAIYCCLNCQATWKVSDARFCRCYRLKIAHM